MSIDRQPIHFGPDSSKVGIDPAFRIAPVDPLVITPVDSTLIDSQRTLNSIETPEQHGAVAGIINYLAPVLSQHVKPDGFSAQARGSLEGHMPSDVVDSFERGSLLPVANQMSRFTEAFQSFDPKVAAKVLEALVARAVMTVNAPPDEFDVQAIVRELSAAQLTLDKLQADSELLAELVDVDTGEQFPGIGVDVQRRGGGSRSLTILPVTVPMSVLDSGNGVIAYKQPKVRAESRFVRDGNKVLLGIGYTDDIVLSEDNLGRLAGEIKPLLKQPRKRLWLTSGLTIKEVGADDSVISSESEDALDPLDDLPTTHTDQPVVQQGVTEKSRPVIVPEGMAGAYWLQGRAGEIDTVIPQADLRGEIGAIRAAIRAQEILAKQGAEVDPVTAMFIGRAIASHEEQSPQDS